MTRTAGLCSATAFSAAGEETSNCLLGETEISSPLQRSLGAMKELHAQEP